MKSFKKKTRTVNSKILTIGTMVKKPRRKNKSMKEKRTRKKKNRKRNSKKERRKRKKSRSSSIISNRCLSKNRPISSSN